MSIVAALLAAMGVVGVLLWRLNQASDAAKGLIETANDLFDVVKKGEPALVDVVTQPR